MTQIWIRNREQKEGNVSSPDLCHLRHLWLELFSRSRLSTWKGSNSAFWCKAPWRLICSAELRAQHGVEAAIRQPAPHAHQDSRGGGDGIARARTRGGDGFLDH